MPKKNYAISFSTYANSVNTFNLTLESINYKVEDSNIDAEETMLGTIKEITIGFRPDVSITEASVIRFYDTMPQVKFKSQLVITTLLQPMIAIPPEGISNASNSVDLVCTASVLNA